MPAHVDNQITKHRPAAEQYFDEHLTHNDYYSQDELRPGRWIGRELERLELKEGDMVTGKHSWRSALDAVLALPSRFAYSLPRA